MSYGKEDLQDNHCMLQDLGRVSDRILIFQIVYFKNSADTFQVIVRRLSY